MKKKIFITSTAAVIFLLLSVVISNFTLDVNKYSVDIDGDSDIKIIYISDLHNNEFGKNNSRLISKITGLSPDIICLGGDFIDEDNDADDNKQLINFITALTSVADVYYCYGNHDLNYFKAVGYDILSEIENTGCTILEENYTDITINGTELRIGGLFDYAFNQKYIPDDEWILSDTYKFLSDFTDTDSSTVLLAHRPDSFIYGNAAYLWDIDFVLSGHTHGGLWRLPFVGGIIAPEQGLFPKYDKGEFDLGNIKMIISSGLNGYENIPRLFNSPEITVIDLY